MPTYYSHFGFVVDIFRPPDSQSYTKIYRDGTLFQDDGPYSRTTYYLQVEYGYINYTKYTFDLGNASATDPFRFVVSSYRSGNVYAEVTFPLETPLILIAGIDGETSTDLLIEYPLKSFIFANPTKRKIGWYCRAWYLNCQDSLEAGIEKIPEPKIIGNLTGCSPENYKGDLSQNVGCENAYEYTYYYLSILSIDNDKTLSILYGRLECCCPGVVPKETPEEVGFVCTCPDWGKATSYNQTLFSSSERLRQWVQSGAGSKADCKHIMAAKRIMGVEQPIYTDPSYSAPPPPATPG
jgi:hypothetical protein